MEEGEEDREGEDREEEEEEEERGGGKKGGREEKRKEEEEEKEEEGRGNDGTEGYHSTSCNALSFCISALPLAMIRCISGSKLFTVASLILRVSSAFQRSLLSLSEAAAVCFCFSSTAACLQGRARTATITG